MQPTGNQERQKLDFEDDEARRERLGKLFSNISKSDSPNDNFNPLDMERSRPHAVPESDVLARVRAFLPDFQASTTAILQQASLDPSSVNVENVKKGERAVAMDLGLGVYDAPGAGEGMEGKGLGPVVDSDATALEGEEDEEEEDEDDEDDDEEDEDDDMDEEEDTSDSSSSDSSNTEVDTTKTPAKSD